MNEILPTYYDNVSDAVDIKIVEEYAGKETAELYICYLTGSISGPDKQLKGFQRIYHEHGQSQIITLVLHKQDLSFTGRGNQAYC